MNMNVQYFMVLSLPGNKTSYQFLSDTTGFKKDTIYSGNLLIFGNRDECWFVFTEVCGTTSQYLGNRNSNLLKT